MFDEIILENSLNGDAIDWQILAIIPWAQGFALVANSV
jgi:hypothetical protein